MLDTLYHYASSLSAPFLKRLLQKRLRAGKEDPERLGERMGVASRPRPDGRLLWIHGASVGEAISALPLLEELQERLPYWSFMMTTGTVSSARLMRQRLSENVIHQFMPMDHPQWVKAFVDHWHPDAVLWLESELWPNMLREIRTRHIPAGLINARMRPQSFRRWGRFKGFARELLSSFEFVLTAAREATKAFEALGARNVRYMGSLKFGARPLPVDQNQLAMLHKQIGTRRCIGFLQTHAGEEALAIEAHTQLQRDYPDLLTIIVPRQPERGREIAELVRMTGATVSLRSLKQGIAASTDIYIADTIGEMGLWYSLCAIAVIGGSFVPHGGQNPLEGTHFGSAILYGPHMFNFLDICNVLEKAGASRALADSQELFAQLAALLNDDEELHRMCESSYGIAGQGESVIEYYANAIQQRMGLS